MADRTKIHPLGPGTLTLDGVDVGYVSQVKAAFSFKEIAAMTAAYGDTPLDIFHISTHIKFTVLFDEISMTQYAKAIQAAQRNVSSSLENVSAGRFAGVRQTAMAMVFTPTDASIASLYAFKAWRVIPTNNRDFDFGIDKQQSLNVEFTCLIDESKTDGYKLCIFGDTTVVADAVAPTATFSPADDATGVIVAVAPTVTFNKAMDPSTLNGNNIVLVPAADAGVQVPVAGTVTYNAAGTIATITPTSSLSAATAYNIIVTSGCKSASGIAFAGTKQSFTTA